MRRVRNIFDQASEARKRRVRINEVLRERRRGGINTEMLRSNKMTFLQT